MEILFFLGDPCSVYRSSAPDVPTISQKSQRTNGSVDFTSSRVHSSEAPLISEKHEEVGTESAAGSNESSSDEDECHGERSGQDSQEEVQDGSLVDGRQSRASRRPPPCWLRDFYVF